MSIRITDGYQKFTLSQEDHDDLLKLTKDVGASSKQELSPTYRDDLFIITGSTPVDKEKAKDALRFKWAQIALKMGFDVLTMTDRNGLEFVARRSTSPIKRLRDQWSKYHENPQTSDN